MRDRLARLVAEQARVRQELDGIHGRLESVQREMIDSLRALRDVLARGDILLKNILRVKDQRLR
jgi:hypothetical protein